MCRQIFLVFQSAVEHQLGHDICILLHGEFIIHGLRFCGQIKSFPGVRLIGAAILLDHGFHITVCGGRDLIANTVHPVFVQGDNIIVALYRIVQLSHRIDLQGKLTVFRSQGRLSAACLIGVPAAGAAVKCGVADQIFHFRRSRHRCQTTHAQHCRTEHCQTLPKSFDSHHTHFLSF